MGSPNLGTRGATSWWRSRPPGITLSPPDMRGYGQTDAPAAIEASTLLYLVGDIVGLVGALGEKTAVVAGHDWGATVASHAALLRPDIFRGVVGLSVPFR